MVLEGACAMTKARVHGLDLSRCRADMLDPRTFVVATALGPPRLWTWTAAAFVEGLRAANAASATARELDRALDLAAAGRASLVHLCESLIERQAPDVAFALLRFEGGSVHVVSAGATRVYLQRGDHPQRLTPRDEPAEGILRARMTHTSIPILAGDVVLAGSVSAFTRSSVAQVTDALRNRASVDVASLVPMLTEPAQHAGVGAAALVVRATD